MNYNQTSREKQAKKVEVIAKKLDLTEEDKYWRHAYSSEPYYVNSYAYDDYEPAYRTGYEGYGRYTGKSFEQAERDLEVSYVGNRGNSRLDWPSARSATRSAWDRLTGRS